MSFIPKEGPGSPSQRSLLETTPRLPARCPPKANSCAQAAAKSLGINSLKEV